MAISRYLLLALVCVSSFGFSQSDTSDELGGWYMYIGANRLSEKWYLHTEAQYRNHEAAPGSIDQLLLRTGLTYRYTNNDRFTGGYAYIANHVYESDRDSPEVEEHRLFQEYLRRGKIGPRIGIEHRYRFEQRWIEDDFALRARYRLMLTYPLNNTVIEKGTWFLATYDELFINTEADYFGLNRFYVATGKQITDNLQLQAGILHQQNSVFGKWNLQFLVLYNMDFRKRSVATP